MRTSISYLVVGGHFVVDVKDVETFVGDSQSCSQGIRYIHVYFLTLHAIIVHGKMSNVCALVTECSPHRDVRGKKHEQCRLTSP